MRIISGSLRGRRLTSLGAGDAAAHLRPTSDRVRESLFNVLGSGAFGDPITGAYVLDLFAGTGALGLEALSRGAAWATFVENGHKSAKLVSDNIALTGMAAQARLLRRDATRLGPPNIAARANLAFLDPPYGRNLGESALQSALRDGWLAPQALVVWEESARMTVPDPFAFLDTRRYGDTHLTFLRAPDVSSS